MKVPSQHSNNVIYCMPPDPPSIASQLCCSHSGRWPSNCIGRHWQIFSKLICQLANFFLFLNATLMTVLREHIFCIILKRVGERELLLSPETWQRAAPGSFPQMMEHTQKSYYWALKQNTKRMYINVSFLHYSHSKRKIYSLKRNLYINFTTRFIEY